MSLYNYQEIDGKIEKLNSAIRSAVLQNNPNLNKGNGISGKLCFSACNEVEIRPDILKAVNTAAEEIKQYVLQILSDNEAREAKLEKLQDELNENICFLRTEKQHLESYLAQKRGVVEKEKGLEGSICMVINRLNETEKELKEVYDVYRSANSKGWKIIFYPELEHKATQYLLEDKDTILEKRKRDYLNAYQKLFAEQQGYLQAETELNRNIKNSMETIATAETILITQKMDLGQIKEMIVKGSNAYIYYSMLRQKIQTAGAAVAFDRDFCDNSMEVMIQQKELEKLLDLWEQNKNDSEAVYRILQEMFDASKTKCFGIDIGKEFDDSVYIRSHFEKVKGILIQSGYIVDGFRVLYEDELDHPLNGGNGGSQTIIKFDEGDELQSVEGYYGVPFIQSSGDAIGELYIVTKNGKRYGPYGESMHRGTKFRLDLPNDAHFIGFYGKSSENQFLTQIGLLYVIDI